VQQLIEVGHIINLDILAIKVSASIAKFPLTLQLVQSPNELFLYLRQPSKNLLGYGGFVYLGDNGTSHCVFH
jgi:hypothetical protein